MVPTQMALHICQPHSKCENLGLTEITPGTNSSDVECGKKTPPSRIVGITVSVVVVAVVTAAVIVFFKINPKICQRPGRPSQSARNDLMPRSQCFSLNTCQEDSVTPTTATPMLTASRVVVGPEPTQGRNTPWPGRQSIGRGGRTSTGTVFFVIMTVFCLNFEVCSGACNGVQYEINGKCCPMCKPGYRVRRHCTEDLPTSCFPCAESTYTDLPNCHTKCLHCTVCDPGRGLRIKTACTQFSDTVCEVLEGHYCTVHNRGSCIQALRHTTCRPGQYIKQRGTAFKDTQCAGCADGTFSNSSLQICQPHSKCEEGLTEITPGTNSSDVECGKKTPPSLIVGITVSVVVVAVVVTAAVIAFLKVNQSSPVSGRPSQSAGNDLTPRSQSFSINTCEEDSVTSTTVTPMLTASRAVVRTAGWGAAQCPCFSISTQSDNEQIS